MRRFSLAFLAFAVLTIPAFAQAKHPFTFEDMMKLKRVGEPEVSPDGKWVIFSVVDVNLEANTKTPHVWIVPTAGGQERGIISDQDADRPRWAPDGKRFAFISSKGGKSQVWVADFDGAVGTVGRVHKLTSLATESSGELWSPDGKNILFTSDVYPECDGSQAAEIMCNAKKVKEAEQSKVKAQLFSHLLYRHWNAYREGKRSHILLIRVPDSFPDSSSYNGPLMPLASDLTPGDYDAPVFSLGGQDDYAFSPDGQEICYTSNHDKNPAASTNNDLWVVPVSGGPAKNITADNPASDSTPLYSPDGRYIAYRAQQRPGYESDRFRLMLYDRKTGEKKNLAEKLSTWVGTFAWLPDSSSIYFSSEALGSSLISVANVDGSGGGILLTHEDGSGYSDDLALAKDGKTLFFTRMTIQRPTEIEKVVIPPGTSERLTHINDEVLSGISMSPLTAFWFIGANGDRVEGFLVKPPNFDAGKKYPVKFLIHGGPQGAWGDDWSYRWNPELFASPTSSTSSGYVVIMINFHGSTGYGQKFIDAINGDWGGAPFEDLMKGLDYAEKTYPFIDKDRECALGASYGGYMANWVLGHSGSTTGSSKALPTTIERCMRSGRRTSTRRISRRRRWSFTASATTAST
jgi:dipeptidyl aminopeptidase/acylaminoacyl peptidase